MNLKFEMGTQVRIIKTCSELDDLSGVVVGISAAYRDLHHFIVLFDKPVDAIGSTAIQITEHCLERI